MCLSCYSRLYKIPRCIPGWDPGKRTQNGQLSKKKALPRSIERANLSNRLPAHLTPNERAGLEAFVDRLYQLYSDDLMHIVLFGSKARGDFDDESDLDLLVVVRMVDADYRQYWDEIVDLSWDIGLTYGIVTSLIIKDVLCYKRMREQPLLLARNIERDGIELWTMQPNVPTPASV
jgi:predicted nucleotidyltransferase